MYTKTHLQMLLSLSITTAVQPAGYDFPLELPSRALLSRTSPGANTQLTYTWPYLDTVSLMASVICISEKPPVKVRGESDPLGIGTANSLVLLLGRYHLPRGFPLTHLPLLIYCNLNIALTDFQILSKLSTCFLLGGFYSFMFVQQEKYMQKTFLFPTFESNWLLPRRALRNDMREEP